jgi:anti-sigma-K factor RskA
VDAVKLTEDRARQLSRLVWRDLLWRGSAVAAAAVAVVGLLVFMFDWRLSHTDRTVAMQVHDATVLNVKRTASRGVAIFHVHLDDGRDVDAVSRLPLMPMPGTYVVINEARHASGRLTWDVVRTADR